MTTQPQPSASWNLRLPVIRDAIDVAFTPNTPVRRHDLFAGRRDQLEALTAAVRRLGAHGIVFGERGVGKTSLVQHSREDLLGWSGVSHFAFETCSESLSFDALWRGVLGELDVFTPGAIGFGAAASRRTHARGKVGDEDLNPSIVIDTLEILAKSGGVVIVLDELDRLKSPALVGTVEVLKGLSDQGIPVTLVLVGVAESVDQLVKAHRSSQRVLVEIAMPRMSSQEAHQILESGMRHIGEMRMEAGVAQSIVLLSNGMPHYVHLLASSAARAAIDAKSFEIHSQHLATGVATALRSSERYLRRRYEAGCSSRSTLGRLVLVACALCPRDDEGWFRAEAVERPLDSLVGEGSGSGRYRYHLKRLCHTEPDPVLTMTKRSGLAFFRFHDPMMQPHTLLTSFAEGLLTAKILDELATA